MKTSVERFVQQLLAMDKQAIWGEFRDAGVAPMRLIETLVVPALEKIGEDWEAGEVALSQVYMSGRICEELINALLPPDSPERRQQPKIAITVLEDYHMLGKHIVRSVLQAGGYTVADYGRMWVEALVQRALRDEIEVLMISTLMLPSALQVKAVREQLPKRVKIVVGGAPFRFDPELWQEVGADAMGYNASDAITLVRKIVGGEL